MKKANKVSKPPQQQLHPYGCRSHLLNTSSTPGEQHPAGCAPPCACSTGLQACWTSGSSQTGRLQHHSLRKQRWHTRCGRGERPLCLFCKSAAYCSCSRIVWTSWPLLLSVCSFMQQAGQLEKARAAYEQAAQSQEKIGSAWHAAKHMETCSAISKDLGQFDRVADFSRQAGSLYAAAGRMAAGELHHRRHCLFGCQRPVQQLATGYSSICWGVGTRMLCDNREDTFDDVYLQ